MPRTIRALSDQCQKPDAPGLRLRTFGSPRSGGAGRYVGRDCGAAPVAGLAHAAGRRGRAGDEPGQDSSRSFGPSATTSEPATG